MSIELLICLFDLILGYTCAEASSGENVDHVGTVEPDLGSTREALRTDDEVVDREAEAIKLDGLNVAQMKELREKAEKFHFQAEVNRMMKLIINSLYRNKEVRRVMLAMKTIMITFTVLQVIINFFIADFLKRINFKCCRCFR